MRRRLGNPELVALVLAALAGLVWLVRLEGHVNTHDREIAGVEQRRKESVDQIRDDLEYIRGRLDEVLDGRLRAPTSGVAPEPAFQLRVRPLVAFSPASIEVRLQVEPGGRARQVLVEFDGPKYSSSLLNIRRDPNAPTVQPPIWYHRIPAGDYVVAATLTDVACDGCRSRRLLAHRQQRLRVSPGAGEGGL